MRARLAHAEYCMGAFLDARNLCPKLSLTSKIEIDPRLFCVDLACIVAAATVAPPFSCCSVYKAISVWDRFWLDLISDIVLSC